MYDYLSNRFDAVGVVHGERESGIENNGHQREEQPQ